MKNLSINCYFRIDPDMKEWLNQHCMDMHTSISNYLRTLIVSDMRKMINNDQLNRINGIRRG